MALIQPPIIYQPFCSAGIMDTDFKIPSPTSTGTDDSYVSQPNGFPIAQQTPLGAGGSPVNRAETNGVLRLYSSILEWINAGGTFTFNDTFSTQNNGYPAGVVLWCASNSTYQLSLINNNTANFVTTPSHINDRIYWLQVGTYVYSDVYSVQGVTMNANVQVSKISFGSSSYIYLVSGTAILYLATGSFVIPNMIAATYTNYGVIGEASNSEITGITGTCNVTGGDTSLSFALSNPVAPGGTLSFFITFIGE